MSFGNGIGELKQVLTSVTPASETQATSHVASTDEAVKAASSFVTANDEASLSTTGGLISKALEASDVRTAKVEALRQAIADGSYNVPSSEVAGKMIQSLLD